MMFLHAGFSQKVDSIYVNLYTDSLKKGTYNYINVDGLLSNGRYLPLDTSHIIFSSSAGTFFGNNLFIDRQYTGDKVSIHVQLKNSDLHKQFDIYVKRKEQDEPLLSEEEIMDRMKKQPKQKKPGKRQG